MYQSDKKTILFITGAFISHSCWEEWIDFFQDKGYKTVAPPWPYKNESAENLRRTQTASKIALLRLDCLLEYYTEIIEKLPEKPILIGHSFGGLLTQLLMQKELGAAGVCIQSFPPRSMITSNFSFYKKLWKPFGFFTPVQKTYLMSFKEWQKHFANQMTFEEQKATYEKFVIPESKLVLRDILSETATINFRKKHNPLLFLSGTADTFLSTSIKHLNFKKYTNVHSITCYKEFTNRNHYVLEQQHWEHLAAFIADWLEQIA